MVQNYTRYWEIFPILACILHHGIISETNRTNGFSNKIMDLKILFHNPTLGGNSERTYYKYAHLKGTMNFGHC